MVGLDVVYSVLDRLNLLGILVRYLDVKVFFKLHDKLYRVQRIGPKIVHKTRTGRDVR